jgi:uncharacterized membrane protein
MKQLLHLALLALLASCHPQQPTVPASAAAEAKALRDAATAARLDSTAKSYYALGQAAADSANFYQAQSHALTPTVVIDTAELHRFFANY